MKIMFSFVVYNILNKIKIGTTIEIFKNNWWKNGDQILIFKIDLFLKKISPVKLELM